MTKTKLIFIGLAVALVGFMFAGSASAQDGPTISVDPTNVEEAGEHTLTVTGSGWSVAATNILPCNIPEGADGAELDAITHCSDMGNLGLGQMVGGVAITDGGFEETITLDIPEQGVFIVSGDSAQTERANAVLITVRNDGGRVAGYRCEHVAVGNHRHGHRPRRCDGVRSQPSAAHPVTSLPDQYTRCPGPLGPGHRSLLPHSSPLDEPEWLGNDQVPVDARWAGSSLDWLHANYGLICSEWPHLDRRPVLCRNCWGAHIHGDRHRLDCISSYRSARMSRPERPIHL